MSKNKEIISVGGYGHSGGTALKDLFKEFNDCSVFETEFRLIKDPYGIMDLEDSLVNNWRNFLNSDVAIKDFLWLVKHLNLKTSKFSKIGFDYSTYLKLDFEKKSHNFIAKISSEKGSGFWHILLFKKNLLFNLYYKMRKKISSKNKYIETLYYSQPDKETFISCVREYLKLIFSELSDTIVLQNAIDTYNPEQGLNYLENGKLIIIDRDPRDIYTEVINKDDIMFLGEGFIKKRDVELFINDFKRRRSTQERYRKNENVLILQFEDLVYKYKETLKDVLKFTDLTEIKHTNPLKFLNPIRSEKNIGIWKEYKYQDEIDLIYKSLHDFCYTESKK